MFKSSTRLLLFSSVKCSRTHIFLHFLFCFICKRLSRWLPLHAQACFCMLIALYCMFCALLPRKNQCLAPVWLFLTYCLLSTFPQQCCCSWEQSKYIKQRLKRTLLLQRRGKRKALNTLSWFLSIWKFIFPLSALEMFAFIFQPTKLRLIILIEYHLWETAIN